MLEGAYDFFQRRRRTFAITAGVVGSVYLATQFARRKLSELQEKLQSDRLAKENLRRRFEQNQQDCSFTVVALLGSLGDQILESINVEKITQTLQQARNTPTPSPMNSVMMDSTTATTEGSGVLAEGSGVLLSTTEQNGTSEEKLEEKAPLTNGAETNGAEMNEENGTKAEESNILAPTIDKKTKMELWNELKIKTFTRTLVIMYSLTLLTLLTHVQLNLLGRYNYISSVVSLFDKNETQEDAIRLETSHRQTILKVETEKKYLTFSWWLLHRGWRGMSERVNAAVEEVMTPVSLKKQLTHNDFTNLLSSIRAKVEVPSNSYRHAFMNDLMPLTPDAERQLLQEGGLEVSEQTVDDELRRLLEETNVILNSEDFVLVLSKCLGKIFEVFDDALRPAFGGMEGEYDSAASGMTGSLHPRFQEIIAMESDASGSHGNSNIPKVKLASLLPIITRQSHLLVHGFPNEYVDSLVEIKELQGLSAVVYSSFDPELLQ